MSMHMAMRADGGLLVVEAQGRFSLAEAKRTFVELLEAADRHATGKVLFDGRQLSGNPAMMERFYYGAFAAESVLTFARRHPFSAMQFAYVLKEPVLDPARFGETVARNRGMLVRSFDDRDAAMEWLGRTAAGGNEP